MHFVTVLNTYCKKSVCGHIVCSFLDFFFVKFSLGEDGTSKSTPAVDLHYQYIATPLKALLQESLKNIFLY